MTYLWFLVASLFIFVIVGSSYVFSMNKMVKKAKDLDLISSLTKRGRSLVSLASTFVILYFSFRIYQFTNGLQDGIYIVPDMLILICILTTALISHKLVSIMKYLIEVGKGA